MADLKEDFDQYISDRQELDSRYDSLREKAVGYINTLIASFGIEATELSFKSESVKCNKVKVCKEKKPVEKNYRTPDGVLWTGRGIAPKAFQVLFDQGHKKEEYYIGPAK